MHMQNYFNMHEAAPESPSGNFFSDTCQPRASLRALVCPHMYLPTERHMHASEFCRKRVYTRFTRGALRVAHENSR